MGHRLASLFILIRRRIKTNHTGELKFKLDLLAIEEYLYAITWIGNCTSAYENTIQTSNFQLWCSCPAILDVESVHYSLAELLPRDAMHQEKQIFPLDLDCALHECLLQSLYQKMVLWMDTRPRLFR